MPKGDNLCLVFGFISSIIQSHAHKDNTKYNWLFNYSYAWIKLKRIGYNQYN